MTTTQRQLGVLGMVVLLAGSATAADKKEKVDYPALGTIERLDPRLDALVPVDAKVERLAEGFDWSEGPLWIKKKGYLLFSDVPMNVVFKWQEGNTSASVFLKPSGYTGKTPRGGEPGSNGLALDPEGRLVLMQHGDRRVARLGEDGKFVTLADKYEGKRFNSPNDGVYKSNGDLYFTDPPYGLLGKNDDPTKEIPFNGVYRLSKDGKVTLLTKELTYPNGLAFTPDEQTLYVANSDPERPILMAFAVKDDGTLGAGRVFFNAAKMAATRPGAPDGLKLDRKGNVFTSGPGGILIFDKNAVHLGTLATGQRTANCAWGDDGSTLYIAADMYIGRVRLTTKGMGY